MTARRTWARGKGQTEVLYHVNVLALLGPCNIGRGARKLPLLPYSLFPPPPPLLGGPTLRCI